MSPSASARRRNRIQARRVGWGWVGWGSEQEEAGLKAEGAGNGRRNQDEVSKGESSMVTLESGSGP